MLLPRFAEVPNSDLFWVQKRRHPIDEGLLITRQSPHRGDYHDTQGCRDNPSTSALLPEMGSKVITNRSIMERLDCEKYCRSASLRIVSFISASHAARRAFLL